MKRLMKLSVSLLSFWLDWPVKKKYKIDSATTELKTKTLGMTLNSHHCTEQLYGACLHKLALPRITASTSGKHTINCQKFYHKRAMLNRVVFM